MRLEVSGDAKMRALGGVLARGCSGGLILYLRGELGTGKTTLVRGFLHELGHVGSVRSPTYTLIEPYRVAGIDVYHFDLYRLGDPEELEYLGIRDYLTPDAIWLIEWPERGADLLPQADLVISIEQSPAGREVELRADSPRGVALLRNINLDKWL